MYEHFGKFLAGESLDMRGEVAMITRNVVIEGEVEEECPEYNGNCDHVRVRGLDTFGAHVKVSSKQWSVIRLLLRNPK